jgi:hypothetical protein
MSELILFSTGRIRVGDVGASLTDEANGVGTIQDISLEVTSQEKALYEAAWLSTWPKVISFYNSGAGLKFTTNDIERDLIRRIAGGTVADNVLSITKTSKPSFMKIELDVQDVDGNDLTIIVYKAYALSVPLSFKIDDHASMQLDFKCIPDSSGNVIDIPDPA